MYISNIQMKRKLMQWSTQILMTLLLIQIIHVHSFNNKEHEKLSLELVHRHDSRFHGEVDQGEAIKGFIKRDLFRREMMYERMGINQGSNRRKDIEMKQEFQLSMHSGRDDELGEYFVGVTVGTPGQKFWLVADTGSELTWFNCMKNIHHHGGGGHRHKHKGGGSKTRTRTKARTKSSHTRSRTGKETRRRRIHSNNPCNGVFCPHHSHTFQQIPCSSKKCSVDLSEVFSLSYCPSPSDPCLYDFSYVDGSSAKGFFGTDTITVNLTNGRLGKIQNTTIGCTQSTQSGITFNGNTGGVLGLGLRKDSFVDKASLQYGLKFSYCLVDHLSHKNVSSYLTFGTPKVKLLSEMKRTELFLYQPFYGVKVTGISIGDQMLKIPPRVWDFEAQGGMIIDSGYSLTALNQEAYDPLFEVLKKSLNNVKMVDERNNSGLEFCFESEGFDESVVPRIVFHFVGGIRFEPPVKSYIIDAAPNVRCFGILSVKTPQGFSVIGNILQQNHLWEFDVEKNTVGFAPSTCN